MIKLPIVLSENDTWQNAVSGAVAKRAELAGYSLNDGSQEYLRPIVLFQAQNKDQEVNVESLKRHLVEVERAPEDKIAVATGDQRQLDGIDLFDPNCRIEYVITVEALKEGWDCSFAYVFCSVARIQSSRNVEQLFGRVLRMPYAKRRQSAELNKAYAYVSEPSFGDAARHWSINWYKWDSRKRKPKRAFSRRFQDSVSLIVTTTAVRRVCLRSRNQYSTLRLLLRRKPCQPFGA